MNEHRGKRIPSLIMIVVRFLKKMLTVAFFLRSVFRVDRKLSLARDIFEFWSTCHLIAKDVLFRSLIL